jgi:hypothetical protein
VASISNSASVPRNDSLLEFGDLLCEELARNSVKKHLNL